MVRRISAILVMLSHADSPLDLNTPRFRLHRLRGSGCWSVRVSANWRITFRFRNGDAWNVDFVDYH